MPDFAIQCASVSKRFKRGQRHDSLRDLLPAWCGRLAGRCSGASAEREFWALREVSFDVPRGAALGIIGPNGAGKSTLLKLLSRIIRPDGGTLAIHGRLTALIEVGAGFHPDLTGRENIYLNGAVLGMPRRQISTRLGDIVEFAGVREFLDTPIKRYSSGMQARLGFAVARHMDPEILLVDEVLAVGDAQFQQRCLERMNGFAHSGRSIAFISHDLQAIAQLCSRTLVLMEGRRTFLGPTQEAIRHYLEIVRGSPTPAPGAGALLRGVRLLGADGQEGARFAAGDRAWLEFEVALDRAPRDYVLCFIVRRATDGLIVADYNLNLPARAGKVAVDFQANLLTGCYALTLGLTRRATLEKIAVLDYVKLFQVTEPSAYAGVAHLAPEVRLVVPPRSSGLRRSGQHGVVRARLGESSGNMRIALDARTVFAAQRRGTGKNLLDVYQHLARLRPDWEFVLYHRGPRAHDPFVGLPNVRTRCLDLRGDRWDLWEHLRLPMAAAYDSADVLHCPANSCPQASVVPMVSTVHDLIPLKLPDPQFNGHCRRFAARVRRCVRRSRRLITVSHWTKQDLVSDLGAEEQRIDVITWAPTSTYAPVRDEALLAAVRARYDIHGRYFFALTGCSRRKNAAGLLRGYAAMNAALRRDVQLVLVGVEPPAKLEELQGMACRLGVANTCVCRGFVPEEDMAALVSGAEALAFCSRYEGFGLPVLEAFACETAVLASNVSSIPEVAGDAVLYCDPEDPQSIAAGLTRLAQDPALRRELVSRGCQRVAGYTWTRTAGQMVDVFERCRDA